MNLTPNFSLEQMTRSKTAKLHGINNVPEEGSELMRNLMRLARALQHSRSILGNHPIYVTSGYRTRELNDLVSGSSTSMHMRGLAADFRCPGFGTAKEVARALANSDIEFDQIIFENAKNPWVHLGLHEVPRRQVLTATFPGPKYVPGIV